jgi:glyoxylase-like metal-dependent hydrolase (beta-lactamase superfamily II)
MIELAPNLHQLTFFPQHMINVYVLGDTLIDAARWQDAAAILKQARTRPLKRIAFTHAHPDHQGAAAEIGKALSIPLWCGTREADGVERGDLSGFVPSNALVKTLDRWWSGPAQRVERGLREGDTVGDFTVLDVPGHSPGHLAYWRERDRVLIAGDVLNGMHMVTTLPGLHEPPAAFTCDAAQNRASIRKLAALKPALICFGHGRPLRNREQLDAFVDQLT